MWRIIPIMLLFAATATRAQVVPAAAGPPDAAPPVGTVTLVMPTIRIVPATAPPAAVRGTADKYRTEIVCRTTKAIGSLVIKHTTCLTRKQWQYVNDENERFARSMVANAVGGQSGN